MTSPTPTPTPTPSQLLFAKQHRERLARIEAAARALIAHPPPPIPDCDEIPAFLPVRKAPQSIMMPISVDLIVECVSAYFDVPKNEILSGRRLGPTVWARQIAYYLSRELTSQSHGLIGVRLGGRDHTTVLHGARRIQKKLADGHQRAIYDVAELTAMVKRCHGQIEGRSE